MKNLPPLARATITGFVGEVHGDAITVAGVRIVVVVPPGLRPHDAVSVRAHFDSESGEWRADALQAMGNPLSPQHAPPTAEQAAAAVPPNPADGNPIHNAISGPPAPVRSVPSGSRAHRFGQTARTSDEAGSRQPEGLTAAYRPRPPFNPSDAKVKF